MRTKLAAASAMSTLLGIAAALVLGAGQAQASETVTVCNRIVGDQCVEYTTCWVSPTGWICTDGTKGGKPPGEIIQPRPIPAD